MTNEADNEQRKALKYAVEKCAETVNRAMLSVLAVALFCLLTTFGAADRSLLAPEASIKVPFTEAQISFVGFLIVAPLLLVVLTVYLHIFYGYWLGLDAKRRAQGLIETYPAVFGIDRWTARLLTAFSFYWLAPLVLATITWKAAARLEWSLPIAIVTGCVIGGLVFLIVRRAAGRWHKLHAASLCLAGLLAVIAPVLIDIIVHHRDPGKTESWERPLDLFRAALKDAWLVGVRLHDANLQFANLTGATLTEAKLGGADLHRANLTRAKLFDANLTGANFGGANLTGADLRGANFTGANLTGANLTGADLSGANLTRARLLGAKLIDASLYMADLSGAKLIDATLTGGTDLTEANLVDANLTKADLSGANLVDANLTRADLTGTVLSKVNGLTCDQMRAAKTDKTTTLPVGLVCTKK